MNHKEEINHTKHLYFTIGFISCLFFVALFMGISSIEKTNRLENTLCYDIASLNQTLNTIENNCGSTFITRKFGEDGWFVFLSNVCDGTKCESKYIPIQECVLYEVKE